MWGSNFLREKESAVRSLTSFCGEGSRHQHGQIPLSSSSAQEIPATAPLPSIQHIHKTDLYTYPSEFKRWPERAITLWDCSRLSIEGKSPFQAFLRSILLFYFTEEELCVCRYNGKLKDGRIWYKLCPRRMAEVQNIAKSTYPEKYAKLIQKSTFGRRINEICDMMSKKAN